MPVAVVTDSSSDLSSADARTYGVEVVPQWIVFGQQRFRDGVDLTRSTFYQRFADDKEHPRTEAFEEEGFASLFGRETSQGNDVVAITVSSKLSDTYKHAVAAAAKYGERVRVVDSATCSGGLYLLAGVAGELAKRGATANEIVMELERAKATQHGYMIMPDLTYLGRSGRLNKAVVALGTVLKVNPILQVKDGLVETGAQTRSYDKSQELVVDIAARNVREPAQTRFVIGHTNAPELAQRIASAIKAKLGAPVKSFTIYEAGPTIAVNGGPGAIAVFSVVAP